MHIALLNNRRIDALLYILTGKTPWHRKKMDDSSSQYIKYSCACECISYKNLHILTDLHGTYYKYVLGQGATLQIFQITFSSIFSNTCHNLYNPFF